MPRGRKRPSHRDPRETQTETCDLCGSLVPVSHLIVSQVDGLRGHAICDFHPFEAKDRVNPSYGDYRRIDPGPVVADVHRRQPVGGPVWFSSDGS